MGPFWASTEMISLKLGVIVGIQWLVIFHVEYTKIRGYRKKTLNILYQNQNNNEIWVQIMKKPSKWRCSIEVISSEIRSSKWVLFQIFNPHIWAFVCCGSLTSSQLITALSRLPQVYDLYTCFTPWGR